MPSNALIELTFAEATHSPETKAFVEAARALPTVSDADIVEHASINPADVKAWLEVAALTLPLLTGMVELIRSRGLKGVRIKVADLEVSADEATLEQLQGVVVAASAARPR